MHPNPHQATAPTIDPQEFIDNAIALLDSHERYAMTLIQAVGYEFELELDRRGDFVFAWHKDGCRAPSRTARLSDAIRAAFRFRATELVAFPASRPHTETTLRIRPPHVSIAAVALSYEAATIGARCA